MRPPMKQVRVAVIDSDDEVEASDPSPLRQEVADFDALVLGGPVSPDVQLDEFVSRPGSVALDPVQCDLESGVTRLKYIGHWTILYI